MPSWCIKDYDLRVRYHDGGVVHAAFKHTVGPYSKWTGRQAETIKIPAREVVATACKRVDFSNPGVNEEHLVSNKNEITCKNCLRVMGVITPKTTSARYVVVDTKTGMYLKRGRGFCKDPWVEDVLDATIYKSRAAAVDKTKRNSFFDADGKEMNHKKYYAIGYKERGELGWYSEYKPDTRYEVKEVKITIE